MSLDLVGSHLPDGHESEDISENLPLLSFAPNPTRWISEESDESSPSSRRTSVGAPGMPSVQSLLKFRSRNITLPGLSQRCRRGAMVERLFDCGLWNEFHRTGSAHLVDGQPCLLISVERVARGGAGIAKGVEVVDERDAAMLEGELGDAEDIP
jgi:hypothetical protein